MVTTSSRESEKLSENSEVEVVSRANGRRRNVRVVSLPECHPEELVQSGKFSPTI